MSLFYDLLKEKATNPETKDKIAYVELANGIGSRNYAKFAGFSYANFYELVNKYIKIIKDSHADALSTMFGNVLGSDFEKINKMRQIVVSNNIASSAAIIATLECGYSPVLFDRTVTRIITLSDTPYIRQRYSGWKASERQKIIDSLFAEAKTNTKFEINDKTEIFICSSGSEGVFPHFNAVTEDELINSRVQYGKENSAFYSYISSANISGLLTNIVNPLVNNTVVVMEEGFRLGVFDKSSWNIDPEQHVFGGYNNYYLSSRDYTLQRRLFFGKPLSPGYFLSGDRLKEPFYTKEEYNLVSHEFFPEIDYRIGSLEEFGIDIDSIMLPRDVIDTIEKRKFDNLDMSNIKHIYLAGGVNRQNVIDIIRRDIPSIPEGVFENLYGATEAGGAICSCPEKDLKSCYIDITRYKKGEIIYTYDRKTFFKLTKDGVEEIEYEFNKLDFVSYIPVSNMVMPNIKIEDDLTVKFKNINGQKWIKSSDLGIYIDGKLYILGRKKALIEIENKTYLINTLEEYFSRVLLAPVLLSKSSTDESYNLFINCGIAMPLKERLKIYKNALRFTQDFKMFKLNPPVILDGITFPKSMISGKISRPRLKHYEDCAQFQFNNVNNYEQAKRDYLNLFIKTYLGDYEVGPIGPDFVFKVKCKKSCFFKSDIVRSIFFKVISYDDEAGEVEVQFTDEFMLEVVPYKIMESYTNNLYTLKTLESEFSRQLVSEQLNDETREILKDIDDYEKAYRPIDLSKMTLDEALAQMRINTVANLLRTLDPKEAEVVVTKLKENLKRGKVKD